MRKLLSQCPSCGSALSVSRLTCTACDVAISGRFAPCEFCRLSAEQTTFLRLFVQKRGNLSDMQQALGISYPTARNKLDEIIQALQQPALAPAVEIEPNSRDAILRGVAAGMISAHEALAQLKRAQQGGE